MKIDPIREGFVAEIAEVDLAKPLEASVATGIRTALDTYAVLIFRDQRLDDDAQIAFSERLGPLERALDRDVYAPGQRPEMTRLTNLDDEGNLLPPDSERVIFNQANEHWHSDSSFKPVPAKFSLLSGREVPPEGGETEFADTRAAYDAWSGSGGHPPKEALEDLLCEHSIVYSRQVITGDIFTEAEKGDLPPVRQALIRTHPVTGRKGFHVGSHASHVIGWPEEKGRAMIRELVDWCVQPPFVYRHSWRPWDLVIWDNRFTLHRGRPFDKTRYRRVMHRTTVAGDGPALPRQGADG